MKEHFEKILGVGLVSDNPADLEAYSYDASELPGKARIVLFPESDEQLRMILSYCNRSNLDIVIRGNGSNNTGMTTPTNCIVVVMQNFNRVHAINIKEQWVHVDCGVTVAELNNILKEHGVRFPIETTNRKLNTVGSILARNAASRHSQKYGRVSNNVKELEIMDGSGKYFTVTKDFAEYLGNEGSAFIIIRAKLKLITIRERSADVAYFDTLTNALEYVAEQEEQNPLSIEFLDSAAATYAGLNTKHAVITEWEDDRGAHKFENYLSLINRRENIRRALGNQGYVILEDSQVQPIKLMEAIDWCIRHNMPVIAHAGIGIVHPFLKNEQEQQRNAWYEWLSENDCSVAGQFGYGIRKKKYVPETMKQKIRRIKERYDYNNIVGRGKIYDYI